jgi:hypothetical protein
LRSEAGCFNLGGYMVRAKSFDGFVEQLFDHDCDYVIAKTLRRRVGLWSWFLSLFGRRNFSWQNFGCRDDYNFYGSLSPQGKVLKFEESFSFQNYSIEEGQDEELRNVINIRCLITAWDRLNRIAERIPGIDCSVVRTHDCGPSGFYVPVHVGMDVSTKQQLFREAVQLKLEPFPF